MRSLRLHLVVLLGFILLTLALTYPLITQIGTHVPGSALWAFDEYTFVWNIWWFKYALLNLNQSPLTTNYIFYPVGVNFALYTFTFFNAALALPLLAYVPLPLVSNLITIFAFVLSGYGTYLLMKYLLSEHQARSADRTFARPGVEIAAMAAGIAYAFTSSKFVYAAIGHYDMVGTEWIPFFVLYCVRALRRASRRDAVVAGVFLALAIYVELIFGVLLGFFLMLYLLASAAWRHLGWRRLGTQVVLLASVAALLTLPVLVPVLGELLFADYSLKGWGDAQKLSVDLFGFFSPSALSTWAGLDWNHELTSVVEGHGRFSDVNTLFIGYATLAVALAGASAYWRKVKVWIAGALTFALLALGPLLQINGVSTYDFEGVKANFPLPFLILHFIPIVQANRVPTRFSAVLVLCVAVLVGYGVWFASGRQSAGVSGAKTVLALLHRILPGLILVLLIFDHLSVPLPLTDARVPSFYETLEREDQDFAILQLPLGWRNSFGTLGAEDTRVQYYQSVHHKRLLGGNTSRNHPFKFEYFASLPIVSSILQIEDYKSVPADVRAFDKQYADEFVRFFDLRYVVVNPAVPGRHPYDDTRAAALAYLLDVLPLEPLPVPGDLIVYEVRQTPLPDELVVDFGEPGARAYQGGGWDREEEIGGVRANWSNTTQAIVLIPVNTVGNYHFSFSALPFAFAGAPPQRMSIAVNAQAPIATVTLNEGWKTYAADIPASALHTGINELTLSFSYARAPQAVRVSDDPRTLSVAFDWLKWTKQ